MIRLNNKRPTKQIRAKCSMAHTRAKHSFSVVERLVSLYPFILDWMIVSFILKIGSIYPVRVNSITRAYTLQNEGVIP